MQKGQNPFETFLLESVSKKKKSHPFPETHTRNQDSTLGIFEGQLKPFQKHTPELSDRKESYEVEK